MADLRPSSSVMMIPEVIRVGRRVVIGRSHAKQMLYPFQGTSFPKILRLEQQQEEGGWQQPVRTDDDSGKNAELRGGHLPSNDHHHHHNTTLKQAWLAFRCRGNKPHNRTSSKKFSSRRFPSERRYGACSRSIIRIFSWSCWIIEQCCGNITLLLRG